MPCRVRRRDRLLDDVGCRLRERGEDPAGVEPAHAQLAEELLPVDVARPELRRRGVPAVGDAERAAYAEAAFGEVQAVAHRCARCRRTATQRMSDVSTPPCRMKSSTRRPTSLSTSAVTTAVRRPKHRRNPRATLYSPPPSQTSERAGVADPSLAGVESQHHFAECDEVEPALARRAGA